MKSTYRDLSHDEILEIVGADAKWILEIGCNDGEDTIEILKRFKQARIACFECDPRAFIEWNKKVPPVSEHRAFISRLALSDAWGLSNFYPSGGSPYSDKPEFDWNKSGSLLKPTEHIKVSPWCTFGEAIAVPTAELDGWLDVFDYGDRTIDFMRIDVQGAEMKVFAGAEKALKLTRFIQAECHKMVLYDGAPTESEMIGYMEARGFACRGRWADDLLFEATR